MSKNLLITGGLGYIGSFTCKNYLLKNKKKIFVIDNLSRGNNFAKKFSSSKIINISNKKVVKILLKKKIETVMHLASLTCVRESVLKKKKYQNDFNDQIKFIKNLKQTNVKNFIFSSSLSIFEKNKYKKNLSTYSKNKFKIEKYLKKISSKNFKVIILRYPNVVGSDPHGRLGEKNNFINRIIPNFYNKIKNQKKIDLYYNFNDKSFPKRNYLHVEDISEINSKVLENINLFKKNFYTFNIYNKKQYSNNDIMRIISKLLNKKPIFQLKKIDKRESMSQISNTKNNLLSMIRHKLKYKDINKIIETNKKWFKKIY